MEDKNQNVSEEITQENTVCESCKKCNHPDKKACNNTLSAILPDLAFKRRSCKKKQTFKEYYWSAPHFRNKLIEKGKKVIVCECGSEVEKWNLSRHKKSKKHIKFMNHIERLRAEGKL